MHSPARYELEKGRPQSNRQIHVAAAMCYCRRTRIGAQPSSFTGGGIDKTSKIGVESLEMLATG
jgi:hypothetical protein